MLDAGFGGIGLPDQGIECPIAQLHKLGMHYGCPCGVGSLLQVSMKYFIIELGFSATTPFGVNYHKCSSLVTHSWIKSLWEKCFILR